MSTHSVKWLWSLCGNKIFVDLEIFFYLIMFDVSVYSAYPVSWVYAGYIYLAQQANQQQWVLRPVIQLETLFLCDGQTIHSPVGIFALLVFINTSWINDEKLHISPQYGTIGISGAKSELLAAFPEGNLVICILYLSLHFPSRPKLKTDYQGVSFYLFASEGMK